MLIAYSYNLKHNPPKAQQSGFIMLSGRNITNDGLNFSKFRFVDEEGFKKEDKRTDIKAGDILLTIVGTIGRCTVFPQNTQKVVFQRSVAVLKVSNELNPFFLSYLIQSPDFQKRIISKSHGTAQKGIYLKTLEIYY